MATTNHERVGKALELLKAGLGPFVDREIRRRIGHFPRNVSEEDARQQVIQEVENDNWQEIRELIAEIERDVHEEIDAEER